MWHKLMEIFGFRERQWSPQSSVSSNESDQTTSPEVNNDKAKPTGRDAGKSNMSSVTQSSKEHPHNKSEDEKPAIQNVTSIFKTSFELPTLKTKTDKAECVECKATASFLALGIILHIWRTMWKRRGEMAPDIQKAVAVMNISLLGMWLTFMEKEWLRPKDVNNSIKPNEENTPVTTDNVKSKV